MFSCALPKTKATVLFRLTFQKYILSVRAWRVMNHVRDVWQQILRQQIATLLWSKPLARNSLGAGVTTTFIPPGFCQILNMENKIVNCSHKCFANFLGGNIHVNEWPFLLLSLAVSPAVPMEKEKYPSLIFRWMNFRLDVIPPVPLSAAFFLLINPLWILFWGRSQTREI